MKKLKIKLATLTIAISVLAVFLIGCIKMQEESLENGQAKMSPTPISTPVIIPTPTPMATPEPTPVPITATLISAGDCVIHNTIFKSVKVRGEDSYDFHPIFDGIKDYVQQADYAMISFEGAGTNKRDNYGGFPYFNCPPEIFNAFKYAGFDLVNNSNNHQLDRKIKGMLETRENIKKAGLEVIGAYDGEEPRYIIKDINGIKVGIMAYSYSSNGNEGALTAQERTRHLALFDRPRMEKEIRELEKKVDITVVAMHWGNEYWQKPSHYQISLADDLIQWGADVILGSHPHVVQPSEIREVDGEVKYIIYSMGNFLTNQFHESFDNPKDKKWLREDGMLITLEFVKDPVTQKTIINKVSHIPTWLGREEKDGRIVHTIIPIPTRDCYNNGEYSEEILNKAYESYDRTIGLVSDYQMSD